ncbi:hypothetical protein GGI18_000854 [Coemansia linderi]|uniref:Uncharacterized protein n=1 Tax=Coemansia linderi TaxID=2663919 RepID=A0ACC1KM13_9FUNG|nr:hypothetical protein GGI18_000854 [Coemansia linderi]
MAATSHLFVGRLPREMSSEDLEKIFASYGKLSRCDVKRGASLGYGFVEFDEIRDAEVALKECNGMDVRGERMVVEFAKGPARRRDDNSCFRCGQEGIVPIPVVVGVAAARAGMYRLQSNRQRSRSRDRGDRRDQRGGDRHRPSHHGSGGYSRSRSRGRDSRPHDSHRSGGGYSRRNHSRSASRSPGPRGHRSSGDGGRRPPPGARSRSPPARGQRGDRYPGPKDFDRRSADSAVGEDTFRR